jgi:hypothetical protein
MVLGSWNGTNSAGNWVLNGVYHLKADSVGPTGSVTSTTQTVMVSRSMAHVTAEIYNEAGEVIRRLLESVSVPTDSTLTDVVLSASTLVEGNGSGAGVVRIGLEAGAGSVTLSWEGRTDSGAYTSPGAYWIQVHWDNGKGDDQTITKVLLVTGHPPVGIVWAQPNLLSPGKTHTTFKVGAVQPATATARIYTLAGERLATVTGQTGAGEVDWDAAGLASGTYLVLLDWTGSDGRFLGRGTLKIQVRH